MRPLNHGLMDDDGDRLNWRGSIRLAHRRALKLDNLWRGSLYLDLNIDLGKPRRCQQE